MAKLKVEFEFDFPEEKREAEVAQRATDLFRALTETRRRLRSAIELGHAWDTADGGLISVRVPR